MSTAREQLASAMTRWNQAFLEWQAYSEQTLDLRYQLDLLRAKEQAAQLELNKARDFYKDAERRFLANEE